jgi:PHP family Zn ribbon phosphoesterase
MFESAFDRQQQDGAPHIVEISKSWHSARKDYRCLVCGGTIKKGSRYYRSVYLCDGAFTCDKAHGPYGVCVYWEEVQA